MNKSRETIKRFQKQKELFLEDCRMVYKNCIELLLVNVVIKVHRLKEIGSVAHNSISLIEKHCL